MASEKPQNDNPPIPPPTPPLGGWTFDPQRDERDFGLSDEQCAVAFPNFYAEIDRAVQHRKNSNLPNITSELVDISWRPDEIMRVMIYDRQVRKSHLIYKSWFLTLLALCD